MCAVDPHTPHSVTLAPSRAVWADPGLPSCLRRSFHSVWVVEAECLTNKPLSQAGGGPVEHPGGISQPPITPRPAGDSRGKQESQGEQAVNKRRRKKRGQMRNLLLLPPPLMADQQRPTEGCRNGPEDSIWATEEGDVDHWHSTRSRPAAGIPLLRQQDHNNNVQKLEACDPPEERRRGSATPADQRSEKSRPRRSRRAWTAIVDRTLAKIRVLYDSYKRSGAKWSVPLATLQRGDAERMMSDGREKNVSGGGRQRGDQRNAAASSSSSSNSSSFFFSSGREHHWRRANVDEGRGRGKQPGEAAVGRRPSPSVQRSTEVDSSGRREGRGGLAPRRSASTERQGNDKPYLRTFKYRDKSLAVRRGERTDRQVSSSSEDPQPTVRARPTERRKRPSPNRRTESSRRRQARRTEQSSISSSSSSSSSSSGSVTRTTTSSTRQRVRVARDSLQSQAAAPPEHQNSRDNTKVFLERLDSVLSDLVESEKKKISNYGQTSVAESSSRPVQVNNPQKSKKCHKRREEKKTLAQDTTVSPALQQLRTTLKTVRVKKRPPPPAGDVLEKHSQWFTEGHPRILRSQRTSQLLTQRCYQPPRRRARPRPSDDSTDEDREEPPHPTQEELLGKERPKTDADEDDDDTCYGSDHQGQQQQQQQRPPVEEEPTAVDSGDFSVDSAYTGSRGATPENVLNPPSAVKPRRPSGSHLTAGALRRFRQQPRRCCCPQPTPPLPPTLQAERLQELKRGILREIRDSSLYSDESINLLLEEYPRRRGCHLTAAEVDLVTRSVQEDLGVKPRSAQYLYQILVAAEDDLTTTPEAKREAEAEDASLLTLRSTGKTYLYERKRQREDWGCPGRPHSSSSSSRGRHPRHKAPRRPPPPPGRSQDETEEEAWARAAVGPALATEVREEAATMQQRPVGPAPDTEWSQYVAELCEQFEIKI